MGRVVAAHGLQHTGSVVAHGLSCGANGLSCSVGSSQSRDRIRVSCIRKADSLPLDRQGRFFSYSFIHLAFLHDPLCAKACAENDGTGKKKADRLSPPRPSLVSSTGLRTERPGGQGGMCLHVLIICSSPQANMPSSQTRHSSVQSLCCVRLFATHGLQHARLPCPSPTDFTQTYDH